MGGNAIPNASRILRNNCVPTIEQFNKEVLIPLGLTKDDWVVLGSTGKRSTSGDIDVGVSFPKLAKLFNVKNENDFYTIRKILFTRVQEIIPQYQIVSNGGLVSVGFPIIGQPGEIVQIDFIQSYNLEWSLVRYFAPSDEESKYKAVHRLLLISALFNNLTIRKADDIENTVYDKTFVSEHGNKYPALKYSYLSFGSEGVRISTYSWLSEKSNQILKHPKKLFSEFYSYDFQKVIDEIFGVNKYTIEDFNSFESIWNNILMDENFPFKDSLINIITSFINSIIHNTAPLEMPSEVTTYQKIS